MGHSTRHLLLPPFSNHLPAPVVFRTGCMPAGAAYPYHRHEWGEFVYSYRGVVEVKVGERHYLAPPQYGLWLPPRVEHQGLNRYEAVHCSVYVASPLADGLPRVTCALTINPLIKSVLDHLRRHQVQAPYPDDVTRLLRVLVDQLAAAKCAGSYLPTSEDPQLGQVLSLIEASPHDNRTLAELAKTVHATERTLMRRAQRDLGMSLSEWRQRLRVVKAMSLLETGAKVEGVAFDLGYSSASAFITMFRRLTGETPDEYRRNFKQQ
ncbi:AraC family transcriptional regulator [Halomonas campaniensis]|uniref:AraC family transcriptional regulator n=2 Tax=Halomonas campaniensis TaxID=213554 RepID=A0A246S028_9GAMM|nr:AraC family transcriptional regulator [Halomonas campaniensis]